MRFHKGDWHESVRGNSLICIIDQYRFFTFNGRSANSGRTGKSEDGENSDGA
jgi:hypothetical protein